MYLPKRERVHVTGVSMGFLEICRSTCFVLILYDTFNTFFSHQTGLAILKNKACSKTQGSAPGEAQTRNPLINENQL